MDGMAWSKGNRIGIDYTSCSVISFLAARKQDGDTLCSPQRDRRSSTPRVVMLCDWQQTPERHQTKRSVRQLVLPTCCLVRRCPTIDQASLS